MRNENKNKNGRNNPKEDCFISRIPAKKIEGKCKDISMDTTVNKKIISPHALNQFISHSSQSNQFQPHHSIENHSTPKIYFLIPF